MQKKPALPRCCLDRSTLYREVCRGFSQGTPLAVKGFAAFSSQPILLNTREPRIKSITDFTDQDKIALPAVKVPLQAMLLQMAAAKQWAPQQLCQARSMTVSMTPPDATIALLSGSAGVGSVFSVPPFQFRQLDDKALHTVLNSYDVFGGPHTFTVAWTSSQFRDKNPQLLKALVKAFAAATEMLNKDLKSAAQYWADDVKSKLPVEKVAAIASGSQVKWTMTPQNSMKFAEFMHSVGTIKDKPADWKELFFPEIHDLPGTNVLSRSPLGATKEIIEQ